jgi:hypothetical protein
VGAPLIDLEALRTLRDDLRVRVHLARTDVLEEWERAEAKWFRMQSALSISEDDTLHAAEKAATACRRLAKEIGQGYSRVRRSLHDT